MVLLRVVVIGQSGIPLQLEGIHVPRAIVQRVLSEVDPNGTELRKGHRLKRREYVNPGPNYAWHIDGYDKLKPMPTIHYKQGSNFLD